DVCPGGEIKLRRAATNRAAVPAVLGSVGFSTGERWSGKLTLENNQARFLDQAVKLPDEMEYSSPYWLRQPWETGKYTVPQQRLRGLPEADPALQASFHLEIAGVSLHYTLPVVFKETAPPLGEVYRPSEVVPTVFVRLPESVYLFPDSASREFRVQVQAGKAGVEGKLSLGAGEGWKFSPAAYE